MTNNRTTSNDPPTGKGGPRTRSQGLPIDDVPDGATDVSPDPPQGDNNTQLDAVEGDELNLDDEDMPKDVDDEKDLDNGDISERREESPTPTEITTARDAPTTPADNIEWTAKKRGGFKARTTAKVMTLKEKESDEEAYSSEDSSIKRIKGSIKEHATNLDAALSQTNFVTKDELNQATEQVKNEIKRENMELKDLLMQLLSKHDDQATKTEKMEANIGSNMKDLQQQLARIKQDLTDEFNKSNEEWRIEQTNKIDAQLEESKKAMKEYVLATVKEVAAEEIQETKEKIGKMVSDTAEREAEIIEGVANCKKMMTKLVELENQYGSTSKTSARLRSDCDTARNKITTIEKEMKEVLKTMQNYKSEAEKHIKVLGDIHTLSNSVEQRQSMSEDTAKKCNEARDILTQLQTEIMPEMKKSRNECEELKLQTQREAKATETALRRVMADEEKRQEYLSKLYAIQATFEGFSETVMQIDEAASTTSRVNELASELTAVKVMQQELERRPTIKKASSSKELMSLLKKDLIQLIKTESVKQPNAKTEVIISAKIEELVHAKCEDIIKSHIPTDDKIESVVRHTAITATDVRNILRDEAGIYDKKVQEATDKTRDEIFNRMIEAEGIIKQLETRCNELVESMGKLSQAQNQNLPTNQPPQPQNFHQNFHAGYTKDDSPKRVIAFSHAEHQCLIGIGYIQRCEFGSREEAMEWLNSGPPANDNSSHQQSQGPSLPPTPWSQRPMDQNPGPFVSPPRHQTNVQRNQCGNPYGPNHRVDRNRNGNHYEYEWERSRNGYYDGSGGSYESGSHGEADSENGSYMRSPEGYMADGTPYFFADNGMKVPLSTYPTRADLAGRRAPSESECQRMNDHYERDSYQQQYGPHHQEEWNDPLNQMNSPQNRYRNHQSRSTEFRGPGSNTIQRYIIPEEERMATYLMGRRGIPELQQAHFHELGFYSPESSYQVVMPIHSRIMSNYEATSSGYGPPYHQSRRGPNTKELTASTAFTPLEVTNQDAVITWYNEFAQLAECFCIAVMPFEHIELAYDSTGINLPGVGMDKHNEMGRALALLLSSKLLPMKGNANNSELSQALMMATSQTNPNGYDLLFVMLKTLIKAFDDENLELPWPRYIDHNTIFSFAEAMERTLILSSKQGRVIPPRVAAMHFLQSIMRDGGSTYSIEAQLVKNKLAPIKSNGKIDPMFDLKRMAHDIHRARAKSPTDNDLSNSGRQRQISKAMRTTDSSTNTLSDTNYIKPMEDTIQGCNYRTFVANEVYRQSNDPIRRKTFKPRRRPVPDPTKGNHRGKQRDPTIVCEACGQRGHQAANCFALATAVYVREYLMQEKNEEEVQKALKFWQERNAPYLIDEVTKKPLDRKPMAILKTYMERSWNDLDTILDQINWVIFDEDSMEEEVFGIMGGSTENSGHQKSE